MYLLFRASWQKVIRPATSFPPPPRIMPYGGFSPVRMEASLVAPRPSAAGPGGGGRGTCVPFRVWRWVQMYRFAAVPTGPWLSAVYHVRAGKRYYGLMRRSDELRPAWASSAYSGRSLPWRAVRLTFPALAVVYDRACPSRGLPQPESAITTRPNHPLPRQDLHLQVCPSLKAAHRKLVLTLRGPNMTDACRFFKPFPLQQAVTLVVVYFPPLVFDRCFPVPSRS